MPASCNASLTCLILGLSLVTAQSSAIAKSFDVDPTSDLKPSKMYITKNGTTKPPGAALDHRGGTTLKLDIANLKLDQKIRTTICYGC